MNLYTEFADLVAAFQAAELQHAVCGGVAVAIHGFPRFTKDIDVLIQSEDVSRAVDCATACGFSVPAHPVTFAVNTPLEIRLHRVSKVVGSDYLPLDLMLVTPILQDVWATRTLLEWNGGTVMTVSFGGLNKMKLLSGRDKDLIDIQQLEKIRRTENESR